MFHEGDGTCSLNFPGRCDVATYDQRSENGTQLSSLVGKFSGNRVRTFVNMMVDRSRLDSGTSINLC
jgi:hypothetical protein